ncbi:MAG: response regulator receiver modulated FAD-dependent pyridine nucleotide-disulfide oxidoreductase [Mycobacterium sp.]|nr:response regulator receiver modulated FAD-dependent pyridine nucleotide-disulfide oxidoreductase [Mycobacterium sp.]
MTASAPPRPAILAVADDPVVSLAVDRDLGRRYGADHQLLAAGSADAALVALQELKRRGDRVALLLADYRMPERNGLDFLARATRIFPTARRVLLTSYGDYTTAATDALTVVDVDHYLVMPWDPAEEKLYPMVDALLEAWRASGEEIAPETKVVGHIWSAPSHAVKDFLARNRVPYRWYLVDQPEGRRLLAAAGADGSALPVVITPSGDVLVQPTEADLAAQVGFTTEPSADFYDLIIVGGGPAGLGAAVYGGSEGLRTVLVERTATGGQAGQSSRIENYLGFPDGVAGVQLMGRAERQVVKFGAEVLRTREVVALEAQGSARIVRFENGEEVTAHAVLLTLGVLYRQLPAPGVADFNGSGVYYGSALTEAASCASHDVYIVGGANSAGQAAVYLAGTASSVTMLVRAASLEEGMSAYLIEQIRAIPTITVLTRTEVAGAEGGDHLEALYIRDNATGEETKVAAHWLFVFIGAEPETDWLDGVVALDPSGFVTSGLDLLLDGRRPPGWQLDRDPYLLETSLPGVFAAGDVRAGSVKRVASAVGEGALAVTLVHQYLAKQ